MPKKADSPNISLIKQAVLTKQANKRQATSATKTRGMVAGGGKKPWKQKGTGRARAGSSTSPVWVGGGRAFGPNSDRNYKTRLPKRMQKAAFAELLTLNKDRIKAVPSLAMKEMKTKSALELLKKHGLEGRILLVTEAMQPELIIATNNLKNVSVVVANELSIAHFIDDGTVVMEQAVFDKYFPSSKAPAKKAAEQPVAETAKETK